MEEEVTLLETASRVKRMEMSCGTFLNVVNGLKTKRFIPLTRFNLLHELCIIQAEDQQPSIQKEEGMIIVTMPFAESSPAGLLEYAELLEQHEYLSSVP